MHNKLSINFSDKSKGVNMKKAIIIISSAIILFGLACLIGYLVLNRNIMLNEPIPYFADVEREQIYIDEKFSISVIQDAKSATRIAKAVDKAIYKHTGHLGSFIYYDEARNEWQVQLKGFLQGSAYFILDGRSGAVIFRSHSKF